MPSDAELAPDASGPVGSGDYIVTQGECVSSIAFAHGLFWETIWNDSANAELKEKRKNPDLLLAGDRLFIPEKRIVDMDCATEQKHTFKWKGVPVTLALKVMKDRTQSQAVERVAANNTIGAYDDTPQDVGEVEDPQAEANQPYRLEIDGKTVSGTTDGDGKIMETISPGAHSARLILRPGAQDERIIELQLGGMDPVSEPSGAAKRLRNLGYGCVVTTEMNASIVDALVRFQQEQGLEPAGNLDQQTQDALEQVHGS